MTETRLCRIGRLTVGATLGGRPIHQWLYSAYLLTGIVAGVVGLLHPGRSITAAVGPASLLYSLGLIGSCATGLAAWWGGRPKTELICLLTIGGLTLLHGVIILLAGQVEQGQTALRLVMASVGVLSWAGMRYDTLLLRSQVSATGGVAP